MPIMEPPMGHSIPRLLFLVSLAFFYGHCKSLRMPRLSIRSRTTETNLPSPSSSRKNLHTYSYTQRLDHFNYNPESYTTFQQRYIVDSTHWRGPGAPIFAYLGAEASVEEDVGLGFFQENAPHFHALQLYIEHRYYGKSVPFGTLKEATRNASTLAYLSSAQALADYAEVILHMQHNYSAHNSPIIVIGGSYGGMLASWFRLKYPHIALGALASSAPILYFLDCAPKKGYFDVVSKDFNDTSETCYETIRKSWPEIDQLGSTSSGLSNLTSKFKSCEKFKASDDLKYYLIDMYAGAAQYDAPSGHPVKTICDAIDRAANQTDTLGQIAEAVFSLRGNESCHHFYEDDLDDEDFMQWDWQVCTEMAMPFGLDRRESTMFPYEPFDWKSFMDGCKLSYGVSPMPHWVSTYYGCHNLSSHLRQFGSNIIFSNGLRDPYSSGGVLHNISDSIVALSTVNGSHCLDLGASSASDPKWLVEQKKKEIEIIKEWISLAHVSDATHSLLRSIKLVPLFVSLIFSFSITLG